MPMRTIERQVVFVAGRFRDGGVEQTMNRLAAGMLDEDLRVTFVLGEAGFEGAGSSVPTGVEVRVSEQGQPGIADTLRDVCSRSDQCAVLAFRTSDYSEIVRALRDMRERVRLFLVSGAFISGRHGGRRSSLFRRLKARARMRLVWRQVTGVITHSPEIQEDWRFASGFPAESVHCVPPPVVGDDVRALGSESPRHPWVEEGHRPLLLAVGRLSDDKRFHLLVEALRRLRESVDARLIIVGEGEQRERLEAAARRCNVDEQVSLVGYQPNPYQWMRSADLLVLPSRVETFGLVLIEAMYLGTPFVAAATPPGPRSIQASTGYGTLVSDDTADGFATAIARALAAPEDAHALRTAAQQYDSGQSARAYLSILFPNSPTDKQAGAD